MTRPRLILVALAMLFALSIPSGARAASGICPLTGRGNSFQAYRVDSNAGSPVNALITTPLGTGIGVAGDRDYYGNHGFVIFDAAGHIEAYYSTNQGGLRPSVFVANGSQTILGLDGVVPTQVG